MPRKDPEEFKKYQREQMVRRRAQAKLKTLNAGANLPPADSVDLPSAESPHLPSQPKTNHEPLRPAPAIPAPAMPAVPTKTLVETNESLEIKARHVADLSRQKLDTRGWIIWECSALKNDRIVVVRDETVKGYPPNLPIYTEFDLERIMDLPISTIRLIHEAKKQGATMLPGFRVGRC